MNYPSIPRIPRHAHLNTIAVNMMADTNTVRTAAMKPCLTAGTSTISSTGICTIRTADTATITAR